MPFSLLGILATVFVLGVMVFVHELGHFIVAKLCGVRVEVFSLGFGPRLFGFRKGETDYRVSALPLGGYVKMSGELPGDESTGAENEFAEHPRWQRVLIALAGPCSNFVLAFVLLTCVYLFHDEVEQFYSAPAVLDYVPPGSTADKAGFQTGDRITSYDAVKNPTWEQLAMRTVVNPNAAIPVKVDRAGQTLNLAFTPKDNTQLVDEGLIPIESDKPLQVKEVQAGTPADKAGIRPNDFILELNQRPLHSLPVLIALLQQTGGQTVQLTIERNGKQSNLALAPLLGQNEAGRSVYQIGVRPAQVPIQVVRHPLGQAVVLSVKKNAENSTMIIEILKRILTFRMSAKSVDGPIGIMRVTSEAVQMEGWTPLVLLMAGISLNLGIFNLLPIPILDGGVILTLLIEGILRRDLNQQFKERVYQVAFVFLLMLTVLVIFNDVSKAFFSHPHP